MTLGKLIASFLTRAWAKPQRQAKSTAGPQYPMGLTRDQIDGIQHLISASQWRTYTTVLQTACEADFARVLGGVDHDEYLLLCGRIQARLEVLALPDTITSKASEIDEHSRRAHIDPSNTDHAFYGGPWWQFWRRGGTNGNHPEG